MLLVELVAERVKQDPVPVNLMAVLTMVCSHSLDFFFIYIYFSRLWYSVFLCFFYFKVTDLSLILIDIMKKSTYHISCITFMDFFDLFGLWCKSREMHGWNSLGQICVFIFCVCSCCVQAFNPDNEYHFKNRMKVCQRNWVDVFGEETNMFAVSPSNTYQKVRDFPFVQSYRALLEGIC